MKKLTRDTGFIIALCGLAACASEKVKDQPTIDFSSLGRIRLEISDDKQVSMPAELSRQVSKNLNGWNYPIGEKEEQSFSHVLKATVGEVTHADTPTGFSFSAGNSDPRSIDFQKADVLPITCQLTSILHPEQTRDMNMGFTSNKVSVRSLPSEELGDHISTVCFNLLTEIKWPEDPTKIDTVQSVKPSWMPEIRIETKTTPPVNKNAPANSISVVPNSEARKQMIIYNQGSPVLLQFGYERK